MEQEIKIFEHEKFGKIRVIMVNSEPWFVGKDVATALKYSDTFAALKQHVPDKFKRVINAKILQQMASESKTGDPPVLEFDTPRGMTFINEAGLYKLILRSKLPAAEEFSDWVCGEVLPSIRKYGYYSLVEPKNAPVADKPVHVPNPNRVAGQHKNACLYVSAVNNGTVKFGQSCNVKARKANIQSVHKVKLGEPHTTSDFPRKVACLAEQACKDIFAPYRVEGEFFRVDNDLACRVVDALDKLITALPSALETECANKILELVKIVSDTPEGKALLLQSVNIIVDKKLL